MKKIVAFAASNSKNSINKQLATFAASLTNNIEVSILDLNDFELPLYSIDEETANGIPKKANSFLETIHKADGIILSLAEHNGNFSVAFKNVYDWASRIQPKLWNNIPMLLMATSPGGRGGASVLSIANNLFPHMGGNIIATFSLPSFYENFKEANIVNQEVLADLKEQVTAFSKALNS